MIFPTMFLLLFEHDEYNYELMHQNVLCNCQIHSFVVSNHLLHFFTTYGGESTKDAFFSHPIISEQMMIIPGKILI